MYTFYINIYFTYCHRDTLVNCMIKCLYNKDLYGGVLLQPDWKMGQI